MRPTGCYEHAVLIWCAVWCITRGGVAQWDPSSGSKMDELYALGLPTAAVAGGYSVPRSTGAENVVLNKRRRQRWPAVIQSHAVQVQKTWC